MPIGYTDTPLEDEKADRLDMKKEVEALSEFLIDCPTPMTIAIQGDWGTGKTSMMKMINKKIADSCMCVWFNTWQYSQFSMQDDVPIALLTELLATVGEEGTSLREVVSGFGAKAAKSALGVAAKATGVPGLDKAFESLFKADPVAVATQLKKLKETLANLIQKRLKTVGKDRMVIFVDDLDRMAPDKAVEFLEIIKLFLDIQGCVFVLAVDYEVVSRGTRQKYGADMDELKSRSFFDKIIQLPFNLPVATYTIDTYLQELLKKHQVQDTAPYKNLACASVGTNPRTLKRIVNILELLFIVAKHEREPTPTYRLLLFAVLCLQMAFETVYAQMLADHLHEDIFSVSSDRWPVMFADALDKAPGKREENEKRLVRFFKTLNEEVLAKEDDGWEQFCDVLHKSGLTASGFQQPLMVSEAVKNSFDPLLLSKLPGVCNDIHTRWQPFFDTLQAPPTLYGTDQIVIPAIFAGVVIFTIALTEAGVEMSFYSEEKTEVRKTFLDYLDRAVPTAAQVFPERRPRAYRFLSQPIVRWDVTPEKTDKDVSEKRLEQLKELVTRQGEALWPPLAQLYAPMAKVAAKIATLVEAIANLFKQTLPEKDGWDIEQGAFGATFWAQQPALSVRKQNWAEGYAIALLSEAQNSTKMFLAFQQPYCREQGKDEKEFFQAWKKEFSQLPEVGNVQESTGQNEWHCARVYLPAPVRDWTRGKPADASFAFALDEEQEREVKDFCTKCAGIFATLAPKMDDLAAK